MALPHSAEGIDSLLRLSSGLKNVSGRKKILPGAQFLQDLNAVDTDVEGSSAPMPQPMNLPEADMGGELSPQSYDVRANSVIEPEAAPAEEAVPEENMWTRFGKALAMRSQMGAIPSQKVEPEAPPIETQQVDVSEGLPPVSASQQEAAQEEKQGWLSKIGQALSDYVNPEKRREVGEENKRLLEDAKFRTQGLNPEEERAKMAAQEDERKALANQDFERKIEEAKNAPEPVPVYGASDAVANAPELAAQFQTVTGIDMEDPQVQDAVRAYEAIITGQENLLGESETINREQIERIKQRIANNQATDADKYYIGLALLMPLVIGGIFGKDAGLAVLGGTTQGLGQAIGERRKNLQADEEALSALNKDMANLALKRSEIDLAKLGSKQAVQKMLGPTGREFVEGRKELFWKDPQTGAEKSGILIAPGLVALPEFLTSADDLKNMVKNANELSDVKNYTEELNDLSEDVVNIASQVKDKNLIRKAFIAALSGQLPAGYLSKVSDDINFEGRKQNAGILLENKLGLLANAYAQAKELGQLDRAAQAHINKILTNPANSLATPKDLIDQILSVRKMTQSGLIRAAANKGFAPEFIANDFGRSNRSMYDRLNKKEDEKLSSKLLRE